ncbi:glycine zipper domain-containing protein [Pseudoalteromonas piscicida]|uniref:glycine zipper domain-containing protein n=1 Tax=Pseudoalteromonas piscicida TaxID=43662 RepID=UPI0030C8DC5B
MKSRKNLVAASIMTALLSGCAMTDDTKTRAEGASTGALIGGALGLVLGDNKQAAMIGALIGAVAGDLYAKSVVKKKQDYANTELYMQDVIKGAQDKLIAAKNEREKIHLEIESYTAQLESIEAESQKRSAEYSGLEVQKDSLSKAVSKSAKLVEILTEEIQYQKDVLAQEREAVSVQLASHSETVIQQLLAEKNELELMQAQLASLDRRKLY